MENEFYWKTQLEKGEKLYNDGEIKKACDFFKSLIPERIESLNGNENDFYLSEFLNNYGLCLKDMGNYEKAIICYIKSKKIKEYLGLTYTEEYFFVCINISEIYKSQGRYFESENIYLNLIEQEENFNLRIYYLVYSNLSSLYIRFNNFNTAKKLLFSTLNKIIVNPNTPKVIYCKILNNLSVIYRETGNFKIAKNILLKSIETLNENNSDTRYLATLKYNLAKIYIKEQDWDNALETLAEVINITKPELKNSYNFAKINYNIAVILNLKGDKSLSAGYLKKSIEINKNIGVENLDYAGSILELAIIKDDYEKILFSSQMTNRVISKIILGLAEKDKLSFLNKVEKLNGRLIEFILNNTDMDHYKLKKLYELLARRKGICSNLSYDENFEIDNDSEYEKLKREYAEKILFPPESNIKEYGMRMEFLERKIRTIESINISSKEIYIQKEISLEDISEKLAENSLTIDYYKYKEMESGNEKMMCFTFDSYGKLNCHTLCNMEYLSVKIEGFFSDYKKTSNYFSKQLFNLLLCPVDMYSYEKIIICPTDILFKLPFEALQNHRGELLIELKEITYINSFFSVNSFRQKNYDNEGLSLISNSDFNFEYFKGEKIREIFRAEDEKEKLKSLFENHGLKVSTLNSKSDLLSLKINSILHFISHGCEIDRKDIPSGLKSFILINSDKKNDFSIDNIFSHEDIQNIDISETKLVFLSTCFSGTGNIHITEGSLNFTRILINMEIPTVISSLWDIPDEFAKELSVSFYKYLFDGYTVSNSLRLSKLKVIKSLRQKYGSSPAFCWAFFTVYGNPDISFKIKKR